MASEFKIKRRVEFSETDMAGVVHFSNYFRYMEYAEHAFVRSLGLSIVSPPSMENDGPVSIGWPRVDVKCEYKKPLRFEDEFEVHLKVAKKTEKSITYEFIFHKVGDTGDKGACARGAMTVVCCTIRPGRMQATFIPKQFADKIDVAK
jgi:YbgC/YbaW family acyl-CoA thioester hydrolase